jgi:hypothetical protein
MKVFKIILISIFLVFLSIRGQAQEIINPYTDKSGNPPEIVINNNASYPFQFDTKFWDGVGSQPVGPYDGEYEFELDQFFWWTEYSSQHAISYQYNLVSFPFTKACAFENGCAVDCSVPQLPDAYLRKMYMPNSPGAYDPSNFVWNYPIDPNARMFNKTPLRKFIGSITSDGNNPGHGLISNAFGALNIIPWFNSARENIPHSVIEVLINIHCGTTINTNIVRTFSFIYDNTRGAMRYYPFYDNCDGSLSAGLHDIVFVPQLLVNPSYTTYTNSPTDVIIPMPGSLNYYPFTEISNNGCNSIDVPQLTTDDFQIGGNHLYIFPNPQSLTTALPRSHYGSYLAGYTLNGTDLEKLNPSQLIKMEYNIDQNIDLEIINSENKIIYNPSEVNVTASNLLFPSYYTFKTIRGLYPSIQDFDDINNIDNGGYFPDPRIAPVITDLRSENPSDPANDPDFAARYYLKNGSKIIVEPCVKLYDLTFDVESGATLQFNEYPSIFGKENVSFYDGRYKIRGLGGAILRNHTNIQYVQNGIITQPYNLHYTAFEQIIAGDNVDLNNDATDGPYNLEPNSDVDFQSEFSISLMPGFHAKSGSSFRAFIEPLNLLPACISSWKLSNPNITEEENSNVDNIEIIVYPNPNSGIFTIKPKSTNFSGEKIEVYDLCGKIVYNKEFTINFPVLLDLQYLKAGIYIIEVHANNKSLFSKVSIL